MHERYEEAGQWLIRAIAGFARATDAEGERRNQGNFLAYFRHAAPAEQARLKALWDEAGIGPFPENPT
jgi:hypothetical protein